MTGKKDYNRAGKPYRNLELLGITGSNGIIKGQTAEDYNIVEALEMARTILLAAQTKIPEFKKRGNITDGLAEIISLRAFLQMGRGEQLHSDYFKTDSFACDVADEERVLANESKHINGAAHVLADLRSSPQCRYSLRKFFEDAVTLHNDARFRTTYELFESGKLEEILKYYAHQLTKQDNGQANPPLNAKEGCWTVIPPPANGNNDMQYYSFHGRHVHPAHLSPGQLMNVLMMPSDKEPPERKR